MAELDLDDDVRRFDAVSDDHDLLDGLDPDVDAPASTALDDLRADLQRDVTGQEIQLVVPLRTGWTIRCNVDVESGQLNAWRKRCQDRAMPDGIDDLKFASIVLAAKTTAILKNGVEAHDEHGEPLTFKHKMLWEMTGTTRAVDAVRAVFSRDAHVITAAFEVLREAGYGEDLQAVEIGDDDPS